MSRLMKTNPSSAQTVSVLQLIWPQLHNQGSLKKTAGDLIIIIIVHHQCCTFTVLQQVASMHCAAYEDITKVKIWETVKNRQKRTCLKNPMVV